MKNRSIILITSLFSLMLIGIIVIQAWWIKRALRLNEQEFDSAVYRSLEEVVKQTAEKENFSFIKQEIEGDTIISAPKHVKVIKHHSSKKTSSKSISIRVNSNSDKQSKTIIRIENDENGKKTISNSVIVGASEGAEISPDVPPVPPVPPVPDTKIEDVEVLVRKMSHIKNPDSLTIKPEDLEKIISTQVKQNNLPEQFGFALLKKNGKLILQNAIFGDTTGSYKINLYPNDLFGRDVQLALFFPKKTSRLHGDVWWVFVLSLVFTTAILILFIYSIRMLLRHKKMLAQKNDFINHMSHEFKTPLAGISLGADMLIDKPEKMSGEQIHRVATIIKKQSEHLNREVTGVLLSAQLEENLNNNHAPFNLVDTLKTQLDLFSLQLESKGAKVVTRFSEENMVVSDDEFLWRKVFSNLLDNSLKFSKENPEITISVTKKDSLIKIEFADNGIGIAEKDLPRIFEKFYRSNYYKQSNIQGFGLGLNFVKKVVDSHKGIIKAESELGKGTKITIEINA